MQAHHLETEALLPEMKQQTLMGIPPGSSFSTKEIESEFLKSPYSPYLTPVFISVHLLFRLLLPHAHLDFDDKLETNLNLIEVLSLQPGLAVSDLPVCHLPPRLLLIMGLFTDDSG